MTYQSPIDDLSTARPQGWVRLGDRRVHLGSGETRSAHGQDRLSEQSLKILITLIEARGALVSRRALEAVLWPAGGVGEDGLNNAIARLRRTLDDDPARPQFVLTVPRRGYRLMPTVRTESANSRRRTGYRWAAIGAGLAASTALALTLLRIEIVHEGALPESETDRYVRYEPAQGDPT